MGQKKRVSAARHFTPRAPPSAPGLTENSGSPPPIDSEQCLAASGSAFNAGGYLTNGEPVLNGGEGLESVKGRGEELSNAKGDCEKALVALRRGNSNKALKLARDACNRHESNALVQRIRGHICMRLASVIEDTTTKERHFKEAIDAARKAVLLSPLSIEYAQFHAQLLFEAATDSKGYEEVEQECQRALSIQNPIDPAKESLYEEGQHKLPTSEARIAQVQQELRGLVQKANIASISNWMKTLGTGASEERLRFIHMRKLVEEPMEQRILQAKRPHEVKKSVKTPEEIRKDIEVRVAAARLLQQKRECSSPQSDDGASAHAKGGTRLERRKSSGVNSRKLNQTQAMGERIDRIKAYWNAIKPKEREGMLEVPINALKNHFGSSKVSLGAASLTEALEFAQINKTWRFWVCCNCGDKFVDSQEHAQHTMDKHIDSLPQKLRRLLPSEIDQDMAEQIMDEDCRPFDGPSAIKFLIKSSHADIEEVTVHEQACSDVSITNVDCVNDRANTVESNVGSLVKGNDKITANSTVSKEGLFSPPPDQEKGQNLELTNAHICDGKCQRLKTVQRFVRDMPSYELPYADDVERTKLLQKIYTLFRILIRNKCLASDHMEKIVQYAVDELQSLVPDTSVHYEFNHSPLYVRFLPAPQLHRVLRYLRELVTACGLDHLSDSRVPSLVPNEDDDVIPDRLFLNEDFTTLSLDERLLKDTLAKSVDTSGRTISDHSIKQDGPSNEADTLNCQPLPLMTVKDGESIAHTDLQLVWIYGTADYEYQTGSWKHFREARVQQSRDLLSALEKEFLTLQSLCERKREHLHHEMAVNMAEALCIEELKKREMKVDGTLRSFEAVLKRRQQELLELRSNDLTSQQKLELEIITTIIREAQNVTVPQFSYDSTISVTSSRLCDLDEEDEDAWRVQEFVPQTDSCIEMVIQRQKERCSSEVNKLDARILRVMDNVQRLEQKLGNESVLDYRATVLPLVKAFIKARLEDAAEKDALQKSDAAREAFLAELSRDGKPTVERVADAVKQTKEKSKEKKKNKEQRRVRDGKRVTDIQQRNAIDGTPADDLNESFVDDEDGLEWDEDEDLRQEEEAEMRRQAVLEAEERKLAETLELQRRVEEEAKEKHLANMKRKQTESEAQMLKPHANSSLEFDCSSHCSSSGLPTSLVQTLSESVSDILCGSADISPCESVGSTSFGDSATVESVSLFSSQNLSTLSIEQPKKVLNTKDLKESVLRDPSLRSCAVETTIELEKPLDKPVRIPSFDNDDLLARPKRTSKNRRKRSARTQEDSNNSSSKEEQATAVTQASGHSNGASVDGEITAGTSFAEDGAKVSCELGSVQMLSSRIPSKTLRQLKAEQDDEERFQADLEQAMRQSLANVADPPLEVSSNEGFPLSEPDNLSSASEEVGKGLQNANGQYNCFLNVVIQSLWHLRRFREELLACSSMSHVHVGLPCVVCALRDIFLGLNAPMSNTSKDAVAPTNLRVALSALYSQKDFFQEAQMNDASEVLLVVFDCIHKAFAMATSDGDSDTSNGVGSWECRECRPCIAHSLFGLDIAMQMNCAGCKLESRHLKYTSFFHTINASALRTAKMCNPGSSLDELLRFVDMSHWLACDKDVGGCGKLNHIHYLLREAPHVFITVLGWQNNRESFEDIVATVDALEVDLDVGVVYRGLDEGFKHRLISVICYYGQHYHCFAFNHEIARWVMFDDTTVKVLGMWKDVVDTCQRGHLQPQVLFYEALSN